ncbi:hypothetical protein JYT48_00170 [Mariprofundus ferrooxydans]|nr:hypothetical protein [Mariprofundus ferrooxydans]
MIANMMFILLVFGGVVLAPQSGMAIPAFSSQTGASCRLCHFQGMHALSKYGSDFLRNGFRETAAMKKRRAQKQQKRNDKKPERNE